MKTGTIIDGIGVIAALFMAVNIGHAQFQVSGHYPGGIHGIKAATTPTAGGLYFRDYNLFYAAGIDKDSGLADFDSTVYVQALRIAYLTDWKVPVLNAQYGVDVVVPVYYADVTVKNPFGTFKDSTFTLGDIEVEPFVMTRHWERFDAVVGYAFWAPNGESDPHPLTPRSRFSRILGKGFWGHMFTLGGTWYPTQDKSWAVSILNRYEINMENQDWHITPGDEFTMEWGISRSIMRIIDIGVVGYYQQQVTKDTGRGVGPGALIGNPELKDRVLAVGPEVRATLPRLGFIASVRYLREFGASDGPEGNRVVLTLTTRF